MWARLIGFSYGRILAWLGWSITAKEVGVWVGDRIGLWAGYLSSLSYWLFPGLWKKAYEELQTELQVAAEIAAGPASSIVSSMTGIPVSADAMGKVLSGGLSAGERDAIGASFAAIFDDIFREEPIAAGYLHREPGTQERLAFSRFIGRNAQLQMAGVMVDLIKDRLPSGLTMGLGDIAERMEKILGFEDSQEEIMEPLMEKIIITGMEKRYNRLTLPTDLTPSDAIGMYIKGYLERPLMDKILDNEGVRKDIREMLIQDQAKNPTHADMSDLYQRGVWDHSAVVASFRQQGYLAEDANLKAALLESDRQWKFAYQLADVYEQQFVKSVIQEGEYEGYLRQVQYTADEVSILMETARRKKTLATKTTAKRITGSFNITPERVKIGAGAIIKWNIRNADSISITGLGTVGPRGEQPLAVDRSQTYTLTASNDAGEQEEFYAYVEVRGQPEVKLPRVNLDLSPRTGPIASLRELRWNVTGADSITLDGAPVAAQGVNFVTPVLPTFYTLRATNVAGTVQTQDVALVVLPDDLLNLANLPTASFTITPLVVTKSQPFVEIKWGTTKATSRRLIFPDGHSVDVPENGAIIQEILDSGVFTFEASNLFGTIQRQEATIFKKPAEEEPPGPGEGPPPVLSLTGYPQTVAPGATVTVSWYISGADAGEYIGLAGGVQVVGQTGSKAEVMPTTPGTYTFQLRASNTGGPSSATLPVVVTG